MLARLQTDSLEFRFSNYRQFAGCNFHVSVRQVLEGEKKLKLISALKMVSASKGTISLNSLTDPLKEIQVKEHSAQALEFKDFLQVIENSHCLSITNDQMKVVIYIAGYLVLKNLSGFKMSAMLITIMYW